MFSKIRARVSSAHLMAAMALFLALGGTALAVKKNSVGTKQLKNNAVKSTKLAPDAVDGSKIKNGSVTGSDIDVGTLGKVPAATTADTAGSAGTAATADTSARLDGRTLSQVRGLARGVQDTSAQGLDGTLYEQVMTIDIAIPTGGADVLADASVELVNNSGGQRGAQCELRDDSGVISSNMTVTIPSGFSTTIPLTAFVTKPLGTGAGNPDDVGVFCQGSVTDDDISFTNGNLNVQRIPTAS
jgi:hypothetical protein